MKWPTFHNCPNGKWPLAVMLSGLFCLFAIGRYTWLTFGPGSWGPRFACSEPYFDCGTVSGTHVVEHQFILRNTGRQLLHIIEVKPGCGACLSPSLANREIAPGGISVLKVKLDVSRLDLGRFQKSLLIKTDDPSLPRVVLFVRGTVLSDGSSRVTRVTESSDKA